MNEAPIKTSDGALGKRVASVSDKGASDPGVGGTEGTRKEKHNNSRWRGGEWNGKGASDERREGTDELREKSS